MGAIHEKKGVLMNDPNAAIKLPEVKLWVWRVVEAAEVFMHALHGSSGGVAQDK